MGGLYGAPRILQCIAQEKVIPALACLGKGVSDPLFEKCTFCHEPDYWPINDLSLSS